MQWWGSETQAKRFQCCPLQIVEALQRGAAHESLVCCAAYILGEYGRSLKDQPVQEQFTLLHERFPAVSAEAKVGSCPGTDLHPGPLYCACTCVCLLFQLEPRASLQGACLTPPPALRPGICSGPGVVVVPLQCAGCLLPC